LLTATTAIKYIGTPAWKTRNERPGIVAQEKGLPSSLEGPSASDEEAATGGELQVLPEVVASRKP
jgi:hypothetical protein